LDWITADFTVIRWLGRRKDIEQFDRIQIDRTQALETWAERVKAFLEQGVEVFGFFNNHYAGHSPESVRQFASLLGVNLTEMIKDDPAPSQMTLDLDDD
jgi:uncharacterized protein YecE (DUF72 family)